MTSLYWKSVSLAMIAGLLTGGPAIAQYAPVELMPAGQTATSVMANKISGDISSGKSGSTTVSSRCLADSGPGPERRAMEA